MNEILIKYFGSSEKITHLIKYKDVMDELKGLEIDKGVLFSEILINKKESSISDLNKIVKCDSIEFNNFSQEIKNIIDNMRINDRVSKSVVEENFIFIKSVENDVNKIRGCLNENTLDDFKNKILSFYNICDLENISQIINLSDISAVCVNVTCYKTIILIVGTKTFLGIFNRFCDNSSFFKSILFDLKKSLYYKKMAVLSQRFLTDKRFLIFTSISSLVLIHYINNRVIINEVDVNSLPKNDLPLNEIPKVESGINKEIIASNLKSVIDPVKLDGDLGDIHLAVKNSLTKLGYSVGSIIRAPIKGFYIGLFEGVIYYIIKSFSGQDDNEK